MVPEQQVIEALKKIIDPHTGVSVYDMGLIADLKIEDDRVSMSFIPTSPICPMGLQLAKDIKEQVAKIEGVSECRINVLGHLQADEINKFLNQ